MNMTVEINECVGEEENLTRLALEEKTVFSRLKFLVTYELFTCNLFLYLHNMTPL